MPRQHRQMRRCHAHSSRTGEPCKKWAILGGSVCPTHGGRIPNVKRAAAERLADLIDPDRALREVVRLAYSDVRQLFDAKGALLPITKWPDGLAAAVGGVEVLRRGTGKDGKGRDVLKVKVWDKPAALKMLLTHLGLLKERMELTGPGGGPIQVDRIERVILRKDDGPDA